VSSSEGAGWIAVVGWDEYLHYSDRAPVWIKMPVRLASDDAWLELNPGARGIFLGLLLEYARSACRLRADTRSLSRRLACQVTRKQLEALSQAGFLRIVASSSLAARYHSASARATREEERREEIAKDVRGTRDVADTREERPPAEPSKNGAELERVLPLEPAADADAVERMRARIGRAIP